MAFAIFYNDVDMPYVEEALKASEEGTKYLDGGIGDWRNCPLGQSPFEQFIPTNTARQIICTYGTLAAFRELLLIDAPHELEAIVADMAGNCGAVEPWPVNNG